jgi:hypothetical protein
MQVLRRTEGNKDGQLNQFQRDLLLESMATTPEQTFFEQHFRYIFGRFFISIVLGLLVVDRWRQIKLKSGRILNGEEKVMY